MSNHDHEYYSRREQQERERAERSDDPGARRIHLDMADRYSRMLTEVPLAQPAQAQG